MNNTTENNQKQIRTAKFKSFKKRLKALEAKVVQEGLILTKAQIIAFGKKQAVGEI